MNNLFEAVDKAFKEGKVIKESEYIEDSELSRYDFLKQHMEPEDFEGFMELMAGYGLSYERQDEWIDLVNDFKFTDEEMKKGIEVLNNMEFAKIRYLLYRDYYDKYTDLFGREESFGLYKVPASEIQQSSELQ